MITCQYDKSDEIVVITIEGNVSDEDVQRVTAQLEREKESRGRLFVIGIIREVGAMEPSKFWEDLGRHIQHEEPDGKAAIITDERWKVWFSDLLKPFVGTDVRIFEPHQEPLAREWLRGGAARGQSLT